MKKPSLSFELEGLLRKKGTYVHISELEDFGRSLGFLSSNVDRRLRELRKAGKIESELRTFEGTKTTWWKVVKKFDFSELSTYSEDDKFVLSLL